MQQAVIGVLMIHRKQAATIAVKRKVVNAVVVHTGLQFLLGCGVTGVILVRGHLACDAHRIAPAVKHLRAITLGHGDCVEAVHRH